jgi:V8-like Glu-specific endopeptidase
MSRRARWSATLAAALLVSTSLVDRVGSAERSGIRPFIIGGTSANIADFPYQVALRLGRRLNAGDPVVHYRCGASLIQEGWVLTAGHCFVEYDKDTGTGAAYLDPDYVEIGTGASEYFSTQMTVTRASKVIPHDDFDPSDRSRAHVHDIALVKTKTQVTNGTPVSLNSRAVLSGKAVATGWGRHAENTAPDDTFRQVTMPLVANDVCNKTPGNVGKIGSGMLCAGDIQAGGKDTCQGDSGGPLVQTRGTDRVQIGVTSYGIGCGRKDEPGVYTRVSSYLDWIAMAIIRSDVEDAGSDGVKDMTWLMPTLSKDRVRLVVKASVDEQQRFDRAAAQELLAGFDSSPRISGPGQIDLSKGFPGIGRIRSFASDSWHDVMLSEAGDVFTRFFIPHIYPEGRQGVPSPQPLSNVVAVGAARGWSFALQADGTLVKWNSRAMDLKREEEYRNCHPDC